MWAGQLTQSSMKLNEAQRSHIKASTWRDWKQDLFLANLIKFKIMKTI